MTPSPLTPRQLRAAATAGLERAAADWDRAQARDGDEAALLALLDDWAEHTGDDHRALLARITSAYRGMDAEWEDRRLEDVAGWYDETESLTPVLLWWHATDPGPARCAAAAAGAIRAAGGRSVLDFGCGIGSTGLALHRAGLAVTLADIAGETLAFARWRFSRRGIDASVLDLRERSLRDLGPGSLHGAVMFDVIEHLADPLAHLELLDRVLAPAGVLCVNQLYVPTSDTNAAHFSQHGEALLWLDRHGYRLARVPGVCWVAQKAALTGGAQRRQTAALHARAAASRAADRLDGTAPLGLGARLGRRALG